MREFLPLGSFPLKVEVFDFSFQGTHFIELCCQRNIPLIFLQNITGLSKFLFIFDIPDLREPFSLFGVYWAVYCKLTKDDRKREDITV